METNPTEMGTEDMSDTEDGTGTGSQANSAAWRLFLVLAVAGLLASTSFNLFLFKTNRQLISQRDAQMQLRDRRNQVQAFLSTLVVKDLQPNCGKYPEIRDILGKYGLAPAGPPPPPPPPPS